MRHSYLEVTFRNGRPLAAYYHLPLRDSDMSAKAKRADGGLVVDYSVDGRPIGIEITAPSQLTLSLLNQLLCDLGHDPVAREDLAPLAVA